MLPSAPLKVPSEIETARLHLRIPQAGDLGDFGRFGEDGPAMRYLGGTLPAAVGGWRQLQAALGHWAILGFGLYSILDRQTGAWMGRVGFRHPPGWPGLELVWALETRYWRQGFGREAALAALAHAPAATQPESYIDVENLAAEGLARSLGAKREGDVTLLNQFQCGRWVYS